MEVISDYIKIVTTLLGIAYPILFQVVARLDEKYSSNLIVELFDKEKSKKLFKFFLISSLILIFLWSLKLRPILYLEGLNYYISNSASIFIIVSTALLVIVFFFFVNKILVYYTPSKFINYLIKNHRRSDINLIHFNALADVFLQSIQKKNASNTATISRFFYDAFKNERENSKNKPVLYPISYYQLVYNSIEELALLKNQSDQSLEYRTVGGIWLLGEGQDSEIHENTYIWLWRNISLAIKYENDDMVLHHWENASQFFSYNLSPVRIEHEKDTFEIKNKIEIAKRESERNTFIEFHYALGGLLLYKKRYSCIDRIFNFTRSQPPKYELLPETMQEVFNRYNQFRDPYSINFPWISSKFPFPDLNGIVSDDIIKKWICSYFALLFLRQYTIVPYLYGMEPLAYPSIPNSQGEKKKWIEGLEFFKAIISDFLSNTDLIMTLNYTFLSQEWCKANDKTYPIFYIDAFKEKLEKSYAHAEVNSSISDEKRKIFYTSSSSIIENTLTPYFDIHNSTLITEKYTSWFINGQRMVQSRDAFTDNPEVHHINYDSFLATVLANRIKEGIALAFVSVRTKVYLFNPNDVFKAIDKLNINENYLIVAFGADMYQLINFYKVKDLTNSGYKKTSIVNFAGAGIISQSFFILKKEDLPNIISVEIKNDLIEKYSLEKICSDLNIFASVLDLNLVSPEIRAENIGNSTEQELRKSILLSIVQSIEVRWKKEIEVIEIIEYSEYKEMGMPNNLDEVISF